MGSKVEYRSEEQFVVGGNQRTKTDVKCINIKNNLNTETPEQHEGKWWKRQRERESSDTDEL